MSLTSQNMCQNCGHNHLAAILSLGYLPMSNTLPPQDAPAEPMTYYPLEFFRCGHCELVQLGYEAPQELVFPADYPFLSGITKALRDNFTELVGEIKSFIPLSAQHRILDIGSNDGTLLEEFKKADAHVLGVEPTDTDDIARNKGLKTIKEFFNLSLAQRLARDGEAFDIIAVTNVLAHAQGLNDFLKGITQVLKPKGLVAIEVHSIKTMIQNSQFDKITHEHRRYFSLKSLQNLLARHELEIVHAKWTPSHGGSIRVFAARPDVYHKALNLNSLIDEENAVLQGGAGLQEFKKQILSVKVELQRLVGQIRSEGGRIYGVGAPSRAFALLQLVGIDHFYLENVLEVGNSLKLGRRIPGTYIPILNEQKLFDDQPEYAMMLSWHVAKEVMPKLRAKGFKGKFVLPLPTPKVVNDV